MTLPQPAPRTLIVAYLEDHPKMIKVLRAARARAEEKNAKWRAVYIETPAQASSMDDDAHERMLRQLTLAEQMGGEPMHIEASTVEEGFRKCLEAEKSRLIVCIIGTTEPETGWRGWRARRASSWQNAVRIASKFAPVETVPLTGQPFVRSLWPRRHFRPMHLRYVAYALGAVGVAYGCAMVLEWTLPPALFRINSQNITLLFVIACAFIASRYGLLPGLVASVGGFFAANYYFTPLWHSIQISNITSALNMVLFLSAAILISLFTSQARDYAELAARRELGTQALFALYRIASNAFSRQQALEKLQRKLARMLEMDVAFFLPPALNPDRIEPAYPVDLPLSIDDRKALEMCWYEIKTTGLASPFNPGTRWRFEPMLAPGGEIGVLGVHPPSQQSLDPWYGRLLTAIADQTASVLEHIELERSMEANRIREEREKLRAMLLSSVSHDLKTPLSGIIGALSAYLGLGDRLTPQRRTDLLETALEEAHRLDSFINNILNMTRLESGRVEFRPEWQSIETMVKQVVKRLHHRLRHHQLVVHPFPAGVEVYTDTMMTEQVLQNLIDNACKYTATGTAIEISGETGEKGFVVSVRDHGEGLPADKLAQVFDKYARLQKEDSQVAGTGLGLAICKAVAEAQGGWITAANHPEGGGVFTLCIPQWRTAKMPKPELSDEQLAAQSQGAL